MEKKTPSPLRLPPTIHNPNLTPHLLFMSTCIQKDDVPYEFSTLVLCIQLKPDFQTWGHM